AKFSSPSPSPRRLKSWPQTRAVAPPSSGRSGVSRTREMTRETKIGLLVGLAFIIIVGILLGDSVRHATDVQPAPLPQVGANVRNAVTTPGTPTAAAPISMQGQAAVQNVQPNQTVPTHEEVA